MFEYLEQAQSAVRRINYRIERLAEELGAHSPIVEDYTAQLDLLFGGNLRFRDGVPQLHHPAQIFKDASMRASLENMDETIKSWGDIKKEWEKPYQEAQESEPFGQPIDFKKFINVSMNLPTLLGNYAASDQLPSEALEILSVKGRKNTYDELDKVIDILRRDEIDIPFFDL
jgi:hypothetical protein